MYEFKEIVRYSELDKTLKMTVTAILNLFQDCSAFESENGGVTMEELLKDNMTWVLNSWQVVIHRYPRMGEEITIGTSPYGFKRCIGLRNFYIKDGKGQYLIVASSKWILIDTKTGSPIRSRVDLLDRYELAAPMEMPPIDRRIMVSGSGETKEKVRVKKGDIDSNNHMNNANYVNYALDYIPDSFEVSAFRVEYKKSAVLHDIMIPTVYSEENRIVIEWKTEENEVFAIIEVKG